MPLPMKIEKRSGEKCVTIIRSFGTEYHPSPNLPERVVFIVLGIDCHILVDSIGCIRWSIKGRHGEGCQGKNVSNSHSTENDVREYRLLVYC